MFSLYIQASSREKNVFIRNFYVSDEVRAKFLAVRQIKQDSLNFPLLVDHFSNQEWEYENDEWRQL